MLNSENLGNPKTEKVIFRGSLVWNVGTCRPDVKLSMPHNFAGHHWQDVVQGVYVCMWKRIQR